MRTPNARITATYGIVAGTLYAMQCSMQRLMGYLPNESEVSAFGIASKATMDRHSTVGLLPNIEFVDPKE